MKNNNSQFNICRVLAFELLGPEDLEVKLKRDPTGNHGSREQICT
jgi:hypothetical protein